MSKIILEIENSKFAEFLDGQTFENDEHFMVSLFDIAEKTYPELYAEE